MIEFVGITWESLTGPGVVVVLVVALLELAKRCKVVRGTRAIYLAGFGLAQGIAQIAFWRCREPWGARDVADALLVGIVSAVLALGGHTMAQRLLDQRAEREAARPKD